MPFSGGSVGGLGKHTEGAEIRAALRVMQPPGVEVSHWEEADAPLPFRIRTGLVRRPGEMINVNYKFGPCCLSQESYRVIDVAQHDNHRPDIRLLNSWWEESPS